MHPRVPQLQDTEPTQYSTHETRNWGLIMEGNETGCWSRVGHGLKLLAKQTVKII